MNKSYFLFAFAVVLSATRECVSSQEEEHAIFSAIARGSVRDVRAFLAHDAQAVHARGRDDFTPLHFAAVKPAPLRLWSRNAYVKIAPLLIEAGADTKGQLSHTSIISGVLIDPRRPKNFALSKRKKIRLCLLRNGVDISRVDSFIIDDFVPDWLAIRTEAGEHVFHALLLREVLRRTHFSPEINALMISFLSVAWGEQFGN